MKNFKGKQYGFTIVELVIVMVVIGILSAVALPRMVNLAKQARRNMHLTIANNLYTSVELLRTQWIAMSEPDVITTADGISFFMDHNIGIPFNVGNTRSSPFTVDDCINLWNALLKNPPLVSAEAGCALNGSCKYELMADSIVSDTHLSCWYIDKDGNEIDYDTFNLPAVKGLDIELYTYDRSTNQYNYANYVSLFSYILYGT